MKVFCLIILIIFIIQIQKNLILAKENFYRLIKMQSQEFINKIEK